MNKSKRRGTGCGRNDRPIVALCLTATVGFGALATPMALLAQSGDEDPDKTAASERLAPLKISGQAIPDADQPTKGYTTDSSRGATKTDTPLIETPQQVDVVTREQIADQGSRTINRALRYTPGVFTGLAGASSRQTTIALRGFSGGDVNNTFLDGLRLLSDPGGYSNIQIDPFFLERIDVVKGPNSVLYGRAQPGGLVNFTTKKPLNEQQGHVQFYGGSFDTFGGGFDLTGPLPEADWGSYRVVGSAETSDTQYDVVERRRYTLMPEVRLDFTQDTKLLLQAYLQHEPEGGFHGSVPYDLSVDNSRFGRTVDADWVDASRGNSKFERDEYLVSYKLTHQLNDAVKLTSKARYSKVSVDLAQVFQNGFNGNGADLTRFYTGTREDLNAFSIDNNAKIDFETGPIEHRVLAGLGYQRRDNDVRYASAGATPLDPFDPDYAGDAVVGNADFAPSNDRELRQIGVYIQDQMAWNRWHLVLGGRQDYLEREYESGSTGVRNTRNDDSFSGRAALLYESKSGISPYVSYSEGFNPSAYTPAGNNIAPPTSSHQYEFGVKYQPNGIDALFTLAFYDLIQENVQQRTAVVPPDFINAGDIESRGVEFAAKADLTHKLHLAATYSYKDVEYQDDISQSGVSIQSGNTPVRTPQQQASLWLAYDFPLSVRAGLGGRYVGESYANGANTAKVPDYAVADAFASFDLGVLTPTLDGASLRVNANNILDKKYVQSCFSKTNCYYGTERNVTATLDYRF
ncbi:TonB-dependent siderophore receptor [Salinisphaera orenii]|uniref:TonB-dependent siderophore receptor n=1 Tax=Salinisphaera orenii TaxID=856731 RepID=UPI000DBE8EFE